MKQNKWLLKGWAGLLLIAAIALVSTTHAATFGPIELTLDDGTFSHTREFGTDPAGTDGYDAGLDLNIPISSQVFHSYFRIDVIPTSLRKDIRSSTEDSLSWLLKVILTSDPYTIEWDPSALPATADSFLIKYNTTTVNMRDTNQIANTGDEDYTIVYKHVVPTLQLCELTVIGVKDGVQEYSYDRYFGFGTGATDGYDLGMDVFFPPPGWTYYAYFWIADDPYNYLTTDVRASDVDSATWILRIVNADLYTDTVKWDPTCLADGVWELDDIDDGEWDMKTQDKQVFSEDQILHIKYYKHVSDVEVTSIVLPADTVNCGSVNDVQAYVGNNGSQAATFDVTCTIDGYVNTVNVANLPASDDTLVTFTDWTAPVTPGFYTMTVVTDLTGDANAGNDTLSKDIYVTCEPVICYFELTATPDSLAAGETTTITVKAMNCDSQLITGYHNDAPITLDIIGVCPLPEELHWGGSATAIPDECSAEIAVCEFVNGTATVTLAYDRAECIYVTATDNYGITGTSNQICWYPLGADHFDVDGPDTAYVGCPFTVTVTPRDIYGNEVTAYSYWIEFAANELCVKLPSAQLITGATDYEVKPTNPTDSLKIGVYEIDNTSRYGWSDPIVVVLPVIDQPDAIAASDFPDDQGCCIILTWDFSANHPGIGDCPIIDYYQIYAGTTATAPEFFWATVPATDPTEAGMDAMNVKVSNCCYTGTMYWWVQAVDDDAYGYKMSSSGKEVATDGKYILADVNPVRLSETKGQQNTSALTGPVLGIAIDNIAPTEATFVRAMDTRDDQGGSITVTWNLSTEDRIVCQDQDMFGNPYCIFGVTEYLIYRDGVLVGSALRGESEYADVGVTDDDIHSYMVKAFDGTWEIESAANDARAEDNTVTGDFNSDASVNMDDLMRLGLHWEFVESDIDFDYLYDLNTDGVIDMADVIILGQHWTGGKASSSGFGLNSKAQTEAEITHEANSSFLLNIRVADVQSLVGYQLKVQYDSKSATFVEAKPGDLLQAGDTPLLLVKKEADGVLIASVIPRADEETAANGSGCLVQLRFDTNKPEFEVRDIGLLDIEGNIDMFGTLSVSSSEFIQDIPEVCELYQNYPNPFVVSTSIRYGIPVSMDVKLAVYNIAGQEIITLAEGSKEAGYHTARWDGKDNNGLRVNSGIYFCRLKTKDSTVQKKLIIVQ